LTVTSFAKNRNPVERATVKVELGIAAGDLTQDSKLDRLILAASHILASDAGLGRPVYREGYQESTPGHGGFHLAVSRFPIETVSQLTLGGAIVDSGLYAVWGEQRDHVYRETGWLWTPRASSWLVGNPSPGSEAHDYAIDYVAGWLMPGQAVEWVLNTAKTAGAIVKSTTYEYGDLFFEAGGAGTTDGSEPTWPTTAGETVVDNDITWTAIPAVELPEALQEASLGIVTALYGDLLERDPGISAEEFDRQRIEYHDELVSGVISASVEGLLMAYR
jgi:hypothetical protein